MAGRGNGVCHEDAPCSHGFEKTLKTQPFAEELLQLWSSSSGPAVSASCMQQWNVAWRAVGKYSTKEGKMNRSGRLCLVTLSPICKRSCLSLLQSSVSLSLGAVGQASSVREIYTDSLPTELSRSVTSISRVSRTILGTLHEHLLTAPQCVLLSTKFVCKLLTQEWGTSSGTQSPHAKGSARQVSRAEIVQSGTWPSSSRWREETQGGRRGGSQPGCWSSRRGRSSVCKHPLAPALKMPQGTWLVTNLQLPPSHFFW